MRLLIRKFVFDRYVKKGLCSMLSLLLFFTALAGVRAEEAPPLDAEGFLSEAYGQDEYVKISPEEGVWMYLSSELSVTIRQFRQIDPALVWFESEIKVRGDTRLQSYLTPGKTPGKRMISPIKLSRDNQLVFAISDDYFSRRLNDGHTQGIIIRGGEVLSNKTFKADHASLPNLEVIARFNDGSLKTFLSNAHTAEEYLSMGVTDTFAFGPILVSEGKLGPHMLETDYYYYREPRCAIGMIAPNHYIILTVTGRTDDSRGERFNWLAERMIALGATEALNLDGGGTAALLFMGDMINKSNTSKTIRGVGSLIGFGTSPAATGSDK